jgi:hypothetical protein
MVLQIAEGAHGLAAGVSVNSLPKPRFAPVRLAQKDVAGERGSDKTETVPEVGFSTWSPLWITHGNEIYIM